ncbi:MAG: threonine/serine dehydratase [Alphaproteobacteria bacterium]
MTLSLPTADDLTRACDRLRPVVCRTPLLESSTLNAALGARVLVKAEALQHTGSFKFRGAYYRLSCLDERQRTAGVIAFSSGNFGRALAAAGSLLAIPVTIVMPVDAPRMKIDATRKCGAEVVLSEHGTRNREEAASELAANLARERGATLLHPFDDPLIVAGQGTTAVEMLEQIKQKQCAFDSLLVPVGGGGLISGCALAFANASSATEIYGVEPEGYDGMGRSIAVGKRARADGDRETLCDALQAVMPGEVPFRVARDRLKGAVAVADEPVRAAMALAFTELKIVLEPSGAIALGALLSGGLEIAGKCVGVVASGGNVAVERFKELVA